jgi:hypothetical protein
MNAFDHIRRSITEILSGRRSAALLLALWAAFFALMYMLPVQLIPGNDIQFQATVFDGTDYLELIVLSLLSALVLSMQIEIFRRNRAALSPGAGAVGGVGILSGILSSMFASASCALCIGGLLGFLSANTLVLLVQNKTPIFLAGTALLLVSLYLSSKRLNGVCEECALPAR